MTIKTTLVAGCSAILLLQVPRGFAQDATPTPSAQPSATPAASPPAPAPAGGNDNFRQRMNDRLKTALKASDDEWAVIQPLLEKVQTAQRATMMSRFGGFQGGGGRRGFGGNGGNGGGGNAAPGTTGTDAGGNGGGDQGNRPNRPAPMPEVEALRTALASDSTSNDDIKTKLQALRDARKKSAADLDQARADLAKVLTLRQEATLVQMGLLE